MRRRDFVAFLSGAIARAAGFIEGENISIEWRWAEGQYNRLSSLAGELIGRDVAVIVTWDAPASFAAKAATKTIPIVFATGADPVEIGLVQSFRRPSSNLTGIYILSTDAGPKGAVAGLVGIESGVVSGLENPNDSGVEAPVETTPWKALARRLRSRIREMERAPSFLRTGSIRSNQRYAIKSGNSSKA